MKSVTKSYLDNYISKFDINSITSTNKGIEKEGLRSHVDSAVLANSDHDPKFGSKLMHNWITTDFAESLLEFITPVETSSDKTLQRLGNCQNYVLAQDSNEIIWPSSMPCILPDDSEIKLAYYGESNSGKLKTLYRNGLGLRYGRSMQTIAGLHYNFSMSKSFWKNWSEIKNNQDDHQKFINREYLALARNFRKYSNVLLYFFGASVGVHESFLDGKNHDFAVLHDDPEFGKTFGVENSTCLRMGGLGYTGESQKDIKICYNSLDSYCNSLEQALKRPFADFEEIGLRDSDGEIQQISTNVLQIENEFYSIIRPKRVGKPGKSALASLRKEGIEYIEVRLLDLNPFAANGITKEQIDFLDLFLMTCLFMDSPKCTSEIYEEVETNNMLVLRKGLSKDLKVGRDGVSVDYGTYVNDFLDKMSDVLNILKGSTRYDSLKLALEAHRHVHNNNEQTSRKLHECIKEKGYIRTMLELSKLHRETLNRSFNDLEYQDGLADERIASIERQRDFDGLPQQEFENYVVDYVASSFSD